MTTKKTAELPVCEWDGYCWSTRIAFREWPTNLDAWVEMVPPARSSTGEPAPPSEEQAKALAFLTSPGNKIGAALLEAAKKYHALCVTRGFENKDGTKLQPIRKPAELNKMLQLGTIHIHAIARAKHAYVGMGFHCAWDREHAFGVMLHKRRVVSAGGADHAILEWIAARDGGVQPGEAKKPAAKKAAPKKPAPKKPAAKKPKPAAKKLVAKKR